MRLKRVCAAAVATVLCAAAGAQQPGHPSTPVTADTRIEFHIPPEALEQALNDFSRTTHLAVLFDSDLVTDLTTTGLHGTYTVKDALEWLLVHSGLSFQISQNWIAVFKTPPRLLGGVPGGARAIPDSSKANSTHPEVTSNVSESASGHVTDADLEKVIVTGSRIRDPKAAESAAQRVYDQDALERSGAATLAEFASLMPESLNSVSPVSNLFGNTVGAPQRGNNAFLATGFNLSGLGPEATLTLVDGDRLVSGGMSGTLFDLSLFPVNAVADIVTVTGDTSAVYGSDAIAGVVNILVKPGTNAAESRVRWGTTSDGGGGEKVYSQLVGGKWQDGDGMIAYQLTQQNPILSSTRSYIPPVPQAIDIVPAQRSSALLGKLKYEVTEETSVTVHALYGYRDVSDASSGLGDYLLSSASPVEEYGGTLHIDQQLTPDWTLGVYGSYSKLLQSLTLTISVPGVSPIGEPGDSSLGEFALSANAKSVRLLGRPVKLAFGAGGRKETLTVPASLSSHETSYASLARKVGDMYAESLIPLVGTPHTLLKRLDLSLAAREDYYEAVGPTLNPKAGLVWSPADRLNFRSTFARSYRPPTLDELAVIPFIYTVNVTDHASSIDTLVDQSQGISKPKPETARTITGGLDYDRDGSQSWAASATWFRTVFDNRIATPLIGSVSPTSDIFAQPELMPYLSRSINQNLIRSIFDNPPFVQDYVGVGAGGVMATFDNQLTNIARTVQAGLQASLRYSVGEKPRQFDAYLIANYLLRDMYRSTPTAPIQSLTNNVGQSPNLRARAGVTGSWGRWTSSLNVNYTNGYNDALVSPAQDVNSWTTFDGQLAWRLPIPMPFVQKAQLTFNARNILNTAPPRVAIPPDLSLRRVGFDAANASPFGRTLSIELSVTGW